MTKHSNTPNIIGSSMRHNRISETNKDVSGVNVNDIRKKCTGEIAEHVKSFSSILDELMKTLKRILKFSKETNYSFQPISEDIEENTTTDIITNTTTTYNTDRSIFQEEVNTMTDFSMTTNFDRSLSSTDAPMTTKENSLLASTQNERDWRVSNRFSWVKHTTGFGL